MIGLHCGDMRAISAVTVSITRPSKDHSHTSRGAQTGEESIQLAISLILNGIKGTPHRTMAEPVH
jgi:hypothetical protein